MNLDGIIGKKRHQSQAFLEDGQRVPLTLIEVKGNFVVQTKTKDKEGYNSVKIGFGINKRGGRSKSGESKKAGIKETPRFFREIKVLEASELAPGSEIDPSEIFKAGDIIDVTGVSKGKGFAGGVKRHHFKGGPRTHGQSDRERAPGSIGQTTTPGRVYRGKRMASRMGHEQVTVKNLEVLDVTKEAILVKGLVPGGKNTIVIIKKVGENKKFIPLYKEVSEEPEAQAQPEAANEPEVKVPEEVIEEPAETVKAEENIQATEEVVEVTEEPKTEKVEELKEGEENAGK